MVKGSIERELAAIETQKQLEWEDFREQERAQIDALQLSKDTKEGKGLYQRY
jgi:hypothetical protein